MTTTEDLKQTTPPPLNAHDFLNIDASLSDEERLIRDTVRGFVRRDLLHRLPDAYDNAYLPDDFPRAAGELGLLGMHLQGYGCPGTSAVAYGLACLELEAGDSGLRSFVSVQGSLAMFAIWRYGSEEQKQTWLPAMAEGKAIGCFGLTEPDAGSDPSGMRTTARFEDGQWVLNGSKMWITNGSKAHVAVVWAKTPDGIRGFVVPRHTPGFSTRDIKHKMSLRASTTSELVFEDCRLPTSAALPQATTLRAPLSCLTEARYGIIWGAVGAARACYEAALDYSTTRTQFGRPIAGFQLTQRKLVEMLTEVNTSLMLALHLGRLKDAGQLHPQQVSFGKLHNVQSALDVARSARTILAANGITLEYPVMRHMANLESVLTYEGTGEIHTLIVGHAITGVAAFH
ncbi:MULTISPECIES: acyl-CoA dehydrogenase family protein [Rhodococcus]|uniref:glutaryl-CoA dehydrogenase (ETF) n=1 Tax=Rhodococcus wratislaviensis NBRC 100605 TaxID=1219028 RepID=X0PLF4_RHOWR|nr:MULTISPECIES: acyl-CoA dehydrogenase family protein [Rhodococcus]WAM15377.1 acyl-CoA dehydrogenase family protein [Rhodococcus sp. JS3073]GAF43203.1 glutaryl-CoA dehydrogenase [Rhodococcus wratislaviensis NBRC 100605]